MLASKLKHKLAFDKRSDTDDGYGNVVNGWVEQFVVWGGKKYLVGGESVMAARLAGRQPVAITVRWSTMTEQITNDWRCRDVYTEELFNIRSITPGERREGFLDMLAESGVAEG